MKLCLLTIRSFMLTLSLILMAPGYASDLLPTITVDQLPPEAQQTLAAIKRGGPYAFAKDGAVFGNYGHTLPAHPRGYYNEFTVRTPGVAHRGARRIVVGAMATPSAEYYYSDDHYVSFQRIQA